MMDNATNHATPWRAGGLAIFGVLLLSATSVGRADTARIAAVADQGVPDLSGPWQASAGQSTLTTMDGKAPPLLPAAAKLYAVHRKARAAGNNDFDSMSHCVPPGVPRLALQPFPWDILQGKRHVTFLFEWNHLNRVVYLAEPKHFDTIGPTFLGQSIGHWEGQTLVVDTTSFNGKTLLDDSGLPSSKDLHTVERYRLIGDGKQLELRITITDPKTFTAPWEARLTFDRRPGVLLKEDYCLRRTGLVK